MVQLLLQLAVGADLLIYMLRHHLLLLFVAITVTPGTAVVAAEADGSVLYLHVLDVDRRADVEAHTRGLAELACAALPTPDVERIEVSP